jgi:hypothetical protein
LHLRRDVHDLGAALRVGRPPHPSTPIVTINQCASLTTSL